MAGMENYVLATIPVWGQFIELLRAVLSLLIGLTGSPGLAIILLTVTIRALLVPLTVQAHRANRRMQALQPQLAALQKRYRQDRQKLSGETLRLYREHRINPYTSLLPTLVQIPLLLGLYQVITSVTGGGDLAQGFLWLPALAHAYPWHILPLLAFVFQLLQARMALPVASALPADQQQRLVLQLTQFLPLTALLFGWVAASGLALYWATQAVFGAVQQYFLTGWGALRDWLPFLPEDGRATPSAR